MYQTKLAAVPYMSSTSTLQRISTKNGTELWAFYGFRMQTRFMTYFIVHEIATCAVR